MQAFLSFLSVGMVCGTVLLVAAGILASLPQSKFRSVCMEVLKWIGAAACVLLIVSPIDFIPDVVPVAGWADDIGYIVAGLRAVHLAIKERKDRQLLEA